MALSCFERALALAESGAMSDIWYNISHVCLSLGNVSLTQQARVGTSGVSGMAV
jgi:hypothetical protein